MAKVTILMPTYNVAPYVEEAIQSVVAQTYADFKLLVVDDGSTDGTPDAVRAINDPRIRLVAFPDNVGLADNLNRGLTMIDTELVARMDGDDIAHPQWLESIVEYLDSHPEVGVCGACGTRFGTQQSEIVLPEDHEAIKVGLLFSCSILVPAFRMSLYSDYGMRYRADAFPAEDYKFWTDCIEAVQLHNIPQSLFRYRMHPAQICTSKKEVQREKTDEVRRCMVRRMGTALTQADEDYFVGHFLRDNIGSRAVYSEHKRFGKHLLQINRKDRYYDEPMLKKALAGHTRAILAGDIISNYFSEGYALKSYLRYLFSGTALHTTAKNELRLLAKSLLHRTK